MIASAAVAASLVITGISEVVWEAVTDVCDIVFGLPEMEVT